ncbi:Alpha/Beta hydrolase protein [Chaetomium fimeti]|uniref:Alpha/Beta hydrolase protein n=1 Tax=Chaetomium fimeti TaxID=1854472 RepID=A0AAE0H7U9_9PEZI|nr:Alpha/Beta hydrolase protein [Chaetomium fimeti]
MASKSSAAVLDSGSGGSLQHSAGASKALNEASGFLDTLLRTTGPLTAAQQCELEHYRFGVEKVPNHKIQEEDNVETFDPSKDTRRLIQLAAEKSDDTYATLSEPLSNSITFEIKAVLDRKKVRGTVVDNMLVVAIRGSVTLMDWMVNGNGEPVSSQDIGTPPAQFHRGFLAVAEAMQERLAKHIQATVESWKATQTSPSSSQLDLLLTGHSAGGAVAQLLYAMAGSASSRLAFTAVVPNFRQVHCITFGAPPITTIPIQPPARDPFRSGLFLSIINEGDPVPLAQKEYIDAVIQVFVLSPEKAEELYHDGYPVPRPVFRASGTCVVLRDQDASNLALNRWTAVLIPEERLHQKLFANVAVHSGSEYLERCKLLFARGG